MARARSTQPVATVKYRLLGSRISQPSLSVRLLTRKRTRPITGYWGLSSSPTIRYSSSQSSFQTSFNETLTFSIQIAEKISNCLGRKIVNIKLTEDERIQSYVSQGLPDYYAKFMTSLETATAAGLEERRDDVKAQVVEQITGRPGQTFDAFAAENQAAWQ